MLTVFWDNEGVFVDFLWVWDYHNSDSYCSTLAKLKQKIKRKRPRFLSDVISLHDNARPHVSQQIVNCLQKFRWDFCIIHRTVPIWPQVTTTCLGHWKIFLAVDSNRILRSCKQQGLDSRHSTLSSSETAGKDLEGDGRRLFQYATPPFPSRG
jgi:hypothetical protein